MLNRKLKLAEALIMAANEFPGPPKPRTDVIGIAVQSTKRTLKAKRKDFEDLFAEYPDFKILIDQNCLTLK